MYLLQTSSNKLVTHLFPEVIDYDDKKQPPTAGNKIRVQCQDLVTALMSCAPHYVRYRFTQQISSFYLYINILF